MPLSTQNDLRLLLGVVLTIHLFLPNSFWDSKYMLARQRVGGNDAACVLDCPTWDSVHILQCSHKCAAGLQGLFFFFNCLENFMLFFWFLATNTQMHCVLEGTQGLLRHKDLSSRVSQTSLNALSWRFKRDLLTWMIWLSIYFGDFHCNVFLCSSLFCFLEQNLTL